MAVLVRGAAPETGGTSWTALLDAVRLAPGADVAAPWPGVVERLLAAGQWRRGDPDIMVVLDAGYDAPRIAHRSADPLGRMRSDRVPRRPTRPRSTTRWADAAPGTGPSSSSATRSPGAPRAG